jgi:polar amino acid transport system substrate-binding protein
MKPIVKVGLDFAAPIPLHTDRSSGIFEGFEVDLMNELARQLQFTLEYKVSYWKDIIDDLIHRKIDVICSAATVTDERMKTVAFSRPYLRFHLCLVSHKDHPLSVTDLPDKKVGVRRSTEAEEYLKSRFPGKELYVFDTNDEQYEKLTTKEIDALIDDAPIAYGFSQSNPSIHMAELIESTPSHYAIVLNKENSALQNQLNAAIDTLERNGFLAERRAFWFKDTKL